MNFNNRHIHNRILIMLICMVVFCASVVFEYYVVHESVCHECTGEDCPVCESIENCFNAIRLMSEAFLPAVAIAALGHIVSEIIRKKYDFCYRATPVDFRVRLND